MKHQYFTPPDHGCDKEQYCLICDGGLAVCKVCHLAEGTLTTDCPGEPVPPNLEDLIYSGELDYRDGRGWVSEANPTNQSLLRA
ncbi:hypothetical protein CEB3_c19030 [Peptococcaceae bacterium CEB3]|nr:hypothetical protein CEB3_c19030 [Peptococcaceae bacterium CEB3]